MRDAFKTENIMIKKITDRLKKIAAPLGVGLSAAALLALLLMPSPRARGQASIGSPSSFTVVRQFFLGLQAGCGTNSYTGDANDILTVPLGVTTNVQSPPFALYKGRGFAFMGQVLTSGTGTTNVIYWTFLPGYSNRTTGAWSYATNSPFTITNGDNLSGTMVFGTNIPAAIFDNYQVAQLYSIGNSNGSSIVVSNAAIIQFP